jgi:hypothetical protein
MENAGIGIIGPGSDYVGRKVKNARHCAIKKERDTAMKQDIQ